MADLREMRHAVQSEDDAIEFCFEQGWSDGLPVVPPTEARVQAMLDASGLAADHQIGVIPERRISITAEKVAINAVLAGGRPGCMAVGGGAVEGMCGSQLGVSGPSTETSGPAELMIWR